MAKSCTRLHAPWAQKKYSRLAAAVVTRDHMSPENMLVFGDVVTIKKCPNFLLNTARFNLTVARTRAVFTNRGMPHTLFVHMSVTEALEFF